MQRKGEGKCAGGSGWGREGGERGGRVGKVEGKVRYKEGDWDRGRTYGQGFQ